MKTLITTWLDKKYAVPFVLLGYVIVLQLFLSIDSYLYANNEHYDSAIFFMCGKALMNGYIPYEEFADSKGLLLWAIYGVAYLIDHYSYVGVYWMLCLFYWATLYIDYKIARLWLPKVSSLLASMAMAIPLWYWNFYTESKAEYFCMPFITFLFYQLLFMVKQKTDCRSVNPSFIFVGVSWVAVIMIKWSIAAMMVSLLVSMGSYAFQAKRLKEYLLNVGMGVLLGALPFILYFTLTQSWQAMIQEYFANTMASVSVPLHETIQSYTKEWMHLFTTKRIIYLVYILPLLALWNKKNWLLSSLPFLSALFFVALSIRHDNFGHYISVVGSFAIFAIILFLQNMHRYRIHLRHFCMLLFIGIVYIVWGKIHYSSNFFTKAEEVTDFENINYMISQVEHPTLINIGQDRGFGMGYTLPYCKYWITQMGRTEQMLLDQEKSLYEGKADFICLSGTELVPIYEASILKMGYVQIADYQGNRIYTKHEVKPRSGSFTVTPWDILLKRNLAAVK